MTGSQSQNGRSDELTSQDFDHDHRTIYRNALGLNDEKSTKALKEFYGIEFTSTTGTNVSDTENEQTNIAEAKAEEVPNVDDLQSHAQQFSAVQTFQRRKGYYQPGVSPFDLGTEMIKGRPALKDDDADIEYAPEIDYDEDEGFEYFEDDAFDNQDLRLVTAIKDSDDAEEDTDDMYMACRKGKVDRVAYLVEVKHHGVNSRDRWDSTPLYYACLCGHLDVINYLLSKGARCEEGTFDGERCLYGALNQGIVKVLKRYKVATALDAFHEALRKAFEDPQNTAAETKDISFHFSLSIKNDPHNSIVTTETLSAHRCVLAAQSQYFLDKLQGRWRAKAHVHLKSELLEPKAFNALLRFFYTGRFECFRRDFGAVRLILKQAGLLLLRDELEAIDENLKPEEEMLVVQKRTEYGPLFAACLPEEFLGKYADSVLPALKNFARTGTGTVVDDDTADDTRQSPITDQNVPGAGADTNDKPGTAVESLLAFTSLIDGFIAFADVVFTVEGHEFPCHKVFWISRSPYFEAMLGNEGFMEGRAVERQGGDSDGEREGGLVTIALHDISPTIFARVAEHVYCDYVSDVSIDELMPLMKASDLFLMSSLKNFCATIMIQHVTKQNVFRMIEISRVYDVPRMEDHCAKVLAQHLDELAHTKLFHGLVLADATAIEGRQETDSIPIVDDIRFHIDRLYGTAHESAYFGASLRKMQRREELLAALEKALNALGLDV